MFSGFQECQLILESSPLHKRQITEDLYVDGFIWLYILRVDEERSLGVSKSDFTPVVQTQK